MASLRIFITGSSDGLGQLAARQLIKDGHRVVLHARSKQRAEQAEAGCPGAETVLVGDLSSISETRQLAAEANKLGTFDVVIHNAGIGFRLGYQRTEDGISTLFAVNSLAPYVLTVEMNRPKRLVYVSSQLHSGGDGSLKDVTWENRKYSGFQAYSDSKLHNVLLAFAVARHWPDVQSNAIDPGWIPTKMGGQGAPGSFDQGIASQVFLASGGTKETGKYFKNKSVQRPQRAAEDVSKQEEFLKICEQISSLPFPRNKHSEL